MADSTPLDEAPRVRLPCFDSVFRCRAQRFACLASQRPSLAAYLGFMGRLAEAQHAASLSCLERAAVESLAGSDRNPALMAGHGVLPSGWRQSLDVVARHCSASGPDIAKVLNRLEATPPVRVEAWARSVLAADYQALDPGVAAMLAAALQVGWTRASAQMDAAALQPAPAGNACPVCGSLPVASVIGSGGAVQGLRYLCCSLCSAQWNLPRIRCVCCGSSKGVAYYSVEGSEGAVRVEACETCNTYTKILDLDKDADLDPYADDLASAPLDILMAESGFARFGVNPFLIPGR